MNKIEMLQNDIYAVKQLLTIQRLRAYKHYCLVDDINKSITALEGVFNANA